MAKKAESIEELKAKVVAFRDARNWKQFHNPKDVAISLVLEAGEFMEHFQWKTHEEMLEHIKLKKDDIGEELADVFYWVLLISHDLDIDLYDAFNKKLAKNDKKYPLEKAFGSHKKYNEL